MQATYSIISKQTYKDLFLFCLRIDDDWYINISESDGRYKTTAFNFVFNFSAFSLKQFRRMTMVYA